MKIQMQIDMGNSDQLVEVYRKLLSVRSDIRQKYQKEYTIQLQPLAGKIEMTPVDESIQYRFNHVLVDN